jgi:hypothetical protein
MDVRKSFLKKNHVDICQSALQKVMLDHLIHLKWTKCLATLHLGLREDLKQKIKLGVTNSVTNMMEVLKMFQMFIQPTQGKDILARIQAITIIIPHHHMEIPTPMVDHH